MFPSLKSSMGATALPAISFALQALSAMERFYIFALRIPAFSLSACKSLIHPLMFSSNSTFSNIASAPQLQFLKQNKFFSLLGFYFALCTHPYCLSNCITLNLGFAGHALTVQNYWRKATLPTLMFCIFDVAPGLVWVLSTCLWNYFEVNLMLK